MDALDHRILDLLREDGRAAYQDLGPRVGLSASAVKRRVDRMTADGVIRGFTVVTDPEAVGHGTEAYVEALLPRHRRAAGACAASSPISPRSSKPPP
ncbi:hypothetical protein GCM10025876_12580 [Demequina litorisediminis]|uniref:HTH asnC-type domain-containing protein n=1 Tax=Demequina litorisediminis TaxID=1849022 RepID=A0ABQ6IEC1_9MICO|nr:hypothetical protein GCM10025876_12580 [Demequina litorisediminis]